MENGQSKVLLLLMQQRRFSIGFSNVNGYFSLNHQYVCQTHNREYYIKENVFYTSIFYVLYTNMIHVKQNNN